MKRHIIAAASGALAVVLSAAGAVPVNAQAMQARQVRSAAAPVSSLAGKPHRLFGTLLRTSGTQLVIRLRSGRDLNVDATEAFALKRVSEPLFRGKATVVTGRYGTDGKLHANVVSRGSHNMSNWGSDS